MAEWLLKFGSDKRPDDIFDLLASGKKTIETRPIHPKAARVYTDIQPGDKLVFRSLDSGREIIKFATFVHAYPSIALMLLSEPAEAIHPGIGSAQALLEHYEEVKKKWGADYAHDVDTYGIVAIGLR
jgi:ASC-1-like (ASCH) protein